MTTATQATPEHLVSLYDERVELTRRMAGSERPTGAMAQAVLDKGAELDAACEAYRRSQHPRKHRVLVGGRIVFAVSRTGRSIVVIFDGNIA